MNSGKFTWLTIALGLLLLPLIIEGQNNSDPILAIVKETNLKQNTDSYQKVKSIFDWVTSHISYDTDKPFTFSNSRDDFIELSERVARERKAVCLGYAALFKELCDRAGIPCFVVKGKVYIPEEKEFANHAWVVFQHAGQWSLADPTWGSGFVSGHSFSFNQNWKFFDPKPSQFIETHYPFDPIFQLLEQPVSFKSFESRNLDEAHKDSTFNYEKFLEEKMKNEDHINSIQRALEFKPQDPFLMHDLAVQYQEMASEIAKRCIDEYNENGFIKPSSPCEMSVFEAEKYLKKAIAIFERIIEMEARQKDMAWLNLATAKTNLKTIQILKQN